MQKILYKKRPEISRRFPVDCLQLNYTTEAKHDTKTQGH